MIFGCDRLTNLATYCIICRYVKFNVFLLNVLNAQLNN